jgi:predicted Zn finger-like uncharacterized protein
MYTRCAHCESWLGISAEQLRVGLGQVRCGSCSQIFNALIHLSDAPPQMPQLQPMAPSLPPVATFQIVEVGSVTPPPSPDFEPLAAAGSGAPLPGVLAEIEAAVAVPELGQPMAPDAKVGHAEACDDGKPALQAGADPLEAGSVDNGAQAQSPGLGAAERESANPGENLEREAADLQDAGAQEMEPGANEEAGDTCIAHGSLDQPGAVEEVDADADIDPETLKKMFRGPVMAREPELDADERDLLAGVAQMAVDPLDMPRARQQSGDAYDSGGESRIPTALQADYARLQTRKPNALVHTIVIIASVLALLALPLQYAWFQPQDLATRYPQARPYVRAFCNHVKCAELLPEDRRKIELLGRDVRIHPRFEGALKIHATIVNRGNYAQTYPQLRFTLFNDNGNIIASRLFTPVEYLRRTDVSVLRLQAGESSQIQLDLIAPEDTAVSFEFEFI